MSRRLLVIGVCGLLSVVICGSSAAGEDAAKAQAAAGAMLGPRRVELPEIATGPQTANPIDRLLAPYFREHGIVPGEPVSDRLFARRVFLDLNGLLPSPEQLEAFENDPHPEKRLRLVRRLLDNQRDYAGHWLSFWNDILRNAYRGTGFIDGGRTQITGWLYASLYDNKPYDRFVHELISPVPGSEGFTKGITWRGVVNASQRRELQAAQNISLGFLGINLKCASCHDSFISDWRLSDAYAFASVFADAPLELFRCDKPTGEISEIAFLYPQLGKIDPQLPRQERMKQLADIVTSPQNGRLMRMIVNRLWAEFLGRGIVEPVERLDNEPWNRDLLDWLAADLSDHKHDLKRTMELICTSRAYQMPSVGAANQDADPGRFRGPVVRRMSAEQFLDALSTLTGVWKQPTPDLLKVDGRGQGGQLAAIGEKLPKSETPEDAPTSVRAALAMADPLLLALGQPNREQMVVRRESVATTLQALELTNGETLADLLKRGAQNWQAREPADAETLVGRIYLVALGRVPADVERTTAVALVGSPPTAEGIEDLLWIVTMLPEFQLIE